MIPGPGVAANRVIEDEVLAYKSFPKAHWQQIHSTNPLERLNKEIKRRTNVVGIFPNEAAITRLVGALMLEQNDEWAVTRRCMSLETVRDVCNDATTASPCRRLPLWRVQAERAVLRGAKAQDHAKSRAIPPGVPANRHTVSMAGTRVTHEQKPTRVSFRPWQGLRSDAILQRLFANTATLLGGRGARAIINLAATALAVRAIGLEAFGLTVLVHTYTRIVSDLSRFQSWQAVIRYGAEHNRRGDRYGLSRLIAFTLRLDLLAAGAGMAIALVVAPLAGPLLQWPPGLIGAAQVYAIGVVFMVTATPTGLLRLFDRFDLLALQSTVNAIVRLAGAAGVLVAGGGLYALLGVWFASVVAAGLVLAALAIREARRQSLPAPPLAASWRDLHEGHGGIWSLVIVTNINTSLALSLTHAGTLLVGGLLTPSAAALYHIAREIAGALAKPIQLLGPVIYPEFARLAAERDYRRIRTVFIRASILIAIGVGGVMALVALAGHWLLTLMAGEAGAAAYALLLWLALASAVALMTFALEPLLISVSRQNAVLGARACEAVLFFVASLVLIGAAGLEGAGLAALLARLTGGVLLVVFAREWWRSLGADVG